MPKDITRGELQGLLGREEHLVDVLPAEEYAESHLPGAISIPLKLLDASTTAGLRKDAPVVVYCHDLQ
ncbi:MAG: rhodanese-like domain-containing protein [Chloroflexia bacterium]|nr:rhodanese-like domain-containing protein [Chloroflexia bacterium]